MKSFAIISIDESGSNGRVETEPAPELETDPKSPAVRIAESVGSEESLTVRQTQNGIRGPEAFDRVLAKVPDIEPDPWDRWTSPDSVSVTKS
ncbi:MAG TPA: hypothetical protein VLX28_24945 [Thermoanaerobaculia bacterium]|nr:hypothetical protein [Thermoanaerobaculia bacterium]